MAQTVCVILSSSDRQMLEAIVADRNRPQKHVERARVVLAAAERGPVQPVSRRLGVSRPMVWRWQRRFAEQGADGLLRDKTRKPGKPPILVETVARVVALTCGDPPHEATHWTGRAMARAVGISLTSVQRIWAAHKLQPHRVRTFKRSRDPEFAAKLSDIVGLYMDPPTQAVVLSIDEKRSHGGQSDPLAQSEIASTSLEATHVYRSPDHGTDRYPDGSWGDFRLNGTEPGELATYVTLAGRRRKNVEACVAQQRRRWTVGATVPAQGQGPGSDRAGHPDRCHPGGGPGRLLDPPLVGGQRDRKLCR
jgi:transposase